MNRIQQTALLAFVLLLLMATVGWWLGGKQAQPADAEPAAILFDPGALETVRLLPPEQRKRYLSGNRFSAAPVADPRAPAEGRIAGGSLPTSETQATQTNAVVPANASYRTIRIHQGETLSGIAKRELGSAHAWRQLLQWNGIKDERGIKVGQQLKIYDNQSPVAGTPSTAAASNPVAGMQYHTVQSGDILGRISQKYYNTSREVPRILAANGFTDPHSIKAGQVLKIPPIQ